MNDKDKRLSRHSGCDGVDIPKRRRDDPGCDLLKFFGEVDVILFDHILFYNKEFLCFILSL